MDLPAGIEEVKEAIKRLEERQIADREYKEHGKRIVWDENGEVLCLGLCLRMHLEC